MYGSWDTEWDRHNFCPFTKPPIPHPPLPNNPKKNFFEKNMKKMPPDIIFLYIHVHHKWRTYDTWFLKYKVRQKFSSFWAIFCLFNPLTTWKIKILTLKTTPGDIIILHISNINDNHMMYDSWDKERNRSFLSFWIVLCPFTLLTTQKIKTLKKWKNHLKISFYTGVT